MYTGVVETMGTVARSERRGAGHELAIATDTTGLSAGDSIAIQGVCLTAESVGPDRFTAFCSTETIERTYLGSLDVGSSINIERPVGVDNSFDGHLVTGTVDGTTELKAIDGERLTIATPPQLEPWLVEKGAIALDGVSLTVASVAVSTFTVALIPATRNRTTFAGATSGDQLHWEADLVAKYVAKAT